MTLLQGNRKQRIITAIRNMKYRKSLALFLILAFMISTTGCYRYRPHELKPHQEVLANLSKAKRYFIVHSGKDVFHLDKLVVSDSSKSLKGFRQEVSIIHQSYKTTTQGLNKYKPRMSSPTTEAHIYVPTFTETSDHHITIPISSIQRLEIYDGSSGTSFLVGFGILVGILVVVTLIVLLTKSSCPFVYTYNSEGKHFEGEIYAGAIYSSLERDDYMPLDKISPVNGEYKITIANQLKEKQYTNLAQLIVVDHDFSTDVLLDKEGKPQLISDPVSPSYAIAGNQKDVLPLLTKKDSSSYLFDAASTSNTDFSNIELQFNKPPDAKIAQLVLNAKNSYWLDYIYGKFNEKFGILFNAWNTYQKFVPAEKNRRWSLEQGIPLSVYLYTDKGWKLIDYFNVTGPLASRDIVMPVDVSSIKEDEVRIKLECGFMFWELDYAAVDFQNDMPVKITSLTPAKATDEKGRNVRKELSKTDSDYLAQPEVGNEVFIKYVSPSVTPDVKRTVFLHSRGYYEYIRDYDGIPDLQELNSFNDPGAFTHFAKENLDLVVKESNQYSTADHGN